MKGLRISGFVAFFLTLTAVAALYILPADLQRNGKPVRLTIEPGLSTGAIGRRLEQAGVIRSGWAFRLIAAARRQGSKLKAGPYEFRASEPVWGILDRIAEGDVIHVAVTIPEGWNTREIAGRLADVGECAPGEFLAMAGDAEFIRSLGLPPSGLEGYLFPDTYELIPGTGCRELARRFVTRMLDVYAKSFEARAESLGLARHDVITLASIVEAEAVVAAERPRIAAVFLNRIRLGMKLQSDPTVAYAMAQRPPRIYEKDLAIESPYNTYLVAGLPPGPICSPGEMSLRAVLHPTPGCRDLYFVATGDGHHVFSETNEAHNEARRQVAAARKSPGGD